MSWQKILGILVLIAVFGVVLRPGATNSVAEASGVSVPVVVKSGGADLLDSPNGAIVNQLETGTIVQAISRTPGGDWIFVQLETEDGAEAGVQGWLASASLVSVNPAALPVYGRPQAERTDRRAGNNREGQSAKTGASTAPTATPDTPIPDTPTPDTPTPDTPTPDTPASAPVGPSVLVGDDPFLRVVGVVRSGGAALADGPSGTVLSLLPAGEIVTLLQRGEDDSWLNVARIDGSTGWVERAELLTAGVGKVPRISDSTGDSTDASAPDGDMPDGDMPDSDMPDGDMPDGEIVSTEAASVDERTAVLATVSTDGSRLNIRSGPGIDFPVVAKADNSNSYSALSVDTGEEWVQIEVADAPDGVGWVSARFVTLDRELGGVVSSNE